MYSVKIPHEHVTHMRPISVTFNSIRKTHHIIRCISESRKIKKRNCNYQQRQKFMAKMKKDKILQARKKNQRRNTQKIGEWKQYKNGIEKHGYFVIYIQCEFHIGNRHMYGWVGISFSFVFCFRSLVIFVNDPENIFISVLLMLICQNISLCSTFFRCIYIFSFFARFFL